MPIGIAIAWGLAKHAAQTSPWLIDLKPMSKHMMIWKPLENPVSRLFFSWCGIWMKCRFHCCCFLFGIPCDLSFLSAVNVHCVACSSSRTRFNSSHLPRSCYGVCTLPRVWLLLVLKDYRMLYVSLSWPSWICCPCLVVCPLCYQEVSISLLVIFWCCGLKLLLCH